MTYLLDTHALIWALMDKAKLSKKITEILQDPNNVILASAISFWEISLKYSLGKLKLNGITPKELLENTRKTGFEMIPLLPAEASSYNDLVGIWHRDPFDRMLISQAIQNKLTLMSKDLNIAKYRAEGLKVIW